MRFFFVFLILILLKPILFSQPNISKNTSEYWDTNRAEWVIFRQYLYEYNHQGNLIFSLFKRREAGKMSPEDLSIAESTYDKNGNLLSGVLKEKDSFSGLFQHRNSGMFFYDETGKVIESVIESTSDDIPQIKSRTENQLFYDENDCYIQRDFSTFKNDVHEYNGIEKFWRNEECRTERVELIKDNFSEGTWRTWQYSFNPYTITNSSGEINVNQNTEDTSYSRVDIYDEYSNWIYGCFRSYNKKYETETFMVYNEENQRTSLRRFRRDFPDSIFTLSRHDSITYVNNDEGRLSLKEIFTLNENGKIIIKDTYQYEYYCDGTLKLVIRNHFPSNSMDRTWYEYEEIKPCELEESNFKFTICPNPASQYLSFRAPNQEFETIELQLFSINGHLVLKREVEYPQKNILLRIDNIPEGLYFLVANNGSETVTEKVIIGF